MPKNTVSLSVKLERLSQELGGRIKAARLRRQISATLFAERLGVSRNTLTRLEEGDSAVSLGAYIKALSILGLEQDIKAVAETDKVGRALQDQRDAARTSLDSTQKNKQLKTAFSESDNHTGQSAADIIRQQNNSLIAEILNKPKGKDSHE